MKDPESKEEERPSGGTKQGYTEGEPQEIPEEEFHRRLKKIIDVVGEDVPLDVMKRALHGADGDVQIALNHILSDLELKAHAQGEEEKRESRSMTEKMDGLLSGLAEEVKCPLCLGYLNHPVVLNCVHTYCAHCLEEYLASAPSSSSIECPLCRIQTPLDENGVKGLNYNYYLANIVEKLKTAQSTKMCVECENHICTVFCKQCKAFLCQNCNSRIHSLRLLSEHQRIPFEDCFFPTPRPVPNSPRKHIPPTVDFVIPFNVKKEVCVDLFYSWSRTLWFAPTQLVKGRAVLHDFKAVYIPFWLFEVDVSAKYSCVVYAGTKTNQGIGNIGIPKVGVIDRQYKDLMVCASNCLEAELIAKVEPYKVDQIQASTLKHTEDVEVKGFTMSKEQAWENEANLHLEKLVEQECKSKFNVVNMHIEANIISKKVKRLFVPLYITTYECNNQSYTFVVNGATARCFGHRPFSLGKVTSLTFGSLGAAVGIFSHSRLSA